MKKNNFWSGILIFVLGIFLGGNFTFLSPKNNLEKKEKKELDYKLVEEVYDLLKLKYFDPQVFSEEKKFNYGLVKGLVNSLDDPYSVFLNPKENKSFTDELEGNFEGIGAELTLKEENITIVTPLKNSPAKKAGLMPEDIILKVNQEDITNTSLIEVVKKIRGKKGTEVLLEIFRPKNNKILEIPIIRDTINVASVEGEILKENIALIEINQFGDKTLKEFKQIFKEFKQKKPNAYILDLRYNGGGYLQGAIDILSFFLKSGTEAVRIKTKNYEEIKKTEYYLETDTKTPLVVLINKGSASASEIVTGALKDNNRAIIVGTKSFGKGTVQEIIPFSENSSLRLTVAEWLTPLGKSINKEGISPDIIIEKTEEDYQEEKTPQIDKALEVAEKYQDFLKKIKSQKKDVTK
jgi:carboxyl-terminal processing protease